MVGDNSYRIISQLAAYRACELWRYVVLEPIGNTDFHLHHQADQQTIVGPIPCHAERIMLPLTKDMDDRV